jgi:hypothetical protein
VGQIALFPNQLLWIDLHESSGQCQAKKSINGLVAEPFSFPNFMDCSDVEWDLTNGWFFNNRDKVPAAV